MRELLSNVHTISRSDFIGKARAQELKAQKESLSSLKKKLGKKEKEPQGFKDEIGKAVIGESGFGKDILNELYNNTLGEVETLKKALSETVDHISKLESEKTIYAENYDSALNWAELYDSTTLEAKKVIIRHLIDKIYVSRDYALRVELNISYKQFESLVGTAPQENTVS